MTLREKILNILEDENVVGKVRGVNAAGGRVEYSFPTFDSQNELKLSILVSDLDINDLPTSAIEGESYCSINTLKNKFNGLSEDKKFKKPDYNSEEVFFLKEFTDNSFAEIKLTEEDAVVDLSDRVDKYLDVN